MSRSIAPDSTNVSTTIRILDETSAPEGQPKEDVTSASSGLALWYRRTGGTKTAITPAALSALDDAHSDGGILHIDDGYYRLDVPDAAFASGATDVVIGGTVDDGTIVGVAHPIVATEAGTGSAVTTFTQQDGATGALAGVKTWLTSDAAGSVVVAGPRTTDDSGQSTYYLDSGATYYLWRDSGSYRFTNPQTVTGGTSATHTDGVAFGETGSSDLILGYDEIRRRIGRMLSWDRTPANWDSEQQTDAADFIADGIEQFLHPPPLPGEQHAHQWKFARPRQTIDLWASATITTSGAPVHAAGESTITAASDAFYASMTSKTISFAASGSEYTISEYVSATQIKVTGDASGEASGDDISISADGTYDLPVKFGGIDGKLTFSKGTTWQEALELVNERQIAELMQRGDTYTGRPRVAAVYPKTFDEATGQRWALAVAPIPDAYYQVSYRGQLDRSTIDGSNPFAVAPVHGNTLLYSILSMAERHLQDEGEGPMYRQFLRSLAASVSHDRMSNAAESVGINRDRSDTRRRYSRRRRDEDNYYVDYKGTIPGL